MSLATEIRTGSSLLFIDNKVKNRTVIQMLLALLWQNKLARLIVDGDWRPINRRQRRKRLFTSLFPSQSLSRSSRSWLKTRFSSKRQKTSEHSFESKKWLKAGKKEWFRPRWGHLTVTLFTQSSSIKKPLSPSILRNSRRFPFKKPSKYYRFQSSQIF